MRRQRPATSTGAMPMALCLLRCDDCKEVRTTEHRLRLTADSCALPQRSLPWWLTDATVWEMPRTAARTAMRIDSFHDDAVGPGVGVDADVETESPLAQMKPGFFIVALLTHSHLLPT